MTRNVSALLARPDPVGEWVHTDAGHVVASVFLIGVTAGGAWWGFALVTHGIRGVRKREWAPIGMSPERMRAKNWPVRGTQAVVVSVLAVAVGAFFLCGVAAFLVFLWLLWTRY